MTSSRLHPPLRPSVRLCKKGAICCCCRLHLALRPPRGRRLTHPPLSSSSSFRDGRKTGDIAILFPIRECFTISQLSRLLHYSTTILPVFANLISQLTAGARIASGALDRHPIGEGSTRAPTVACDHLVTGRRLLRV